MTRQIFYANSVMHVMRSQLHPRFDWHTHSWRYYWVTGRANYGGNNPKW